MGVSFFNSQLNTFFPYFPVVLGGTAGSFAKRNTMVLVHHGVLRLSTTFHLSWVSVAQRHVYVKGYTPQVWFAMYQSLDDPTSYVMVPHKLVKTHSDLAIGIYATLVSCWPEHQPAIPISAATLAEYGSIPYGTIHSALKRLAETGWIVIHTDSTRTSHITPTWGNLSYHWKPKSSCYGKPRHIQYTKIDAHLITWTLGTMLLNPNKRAYIDRPCLHSAGEETPLLNFRQIGAYIRAVVTKRPLTDPIYMHIGLADTHGAPLPLPKKHIAFCAQIGIASQQFSHLPQLHPNVFDRVLNTEPYQNTLDDLSFFSVSNFMPLFMGIIMTLGHDEDTENDSSESEDQEDLSNHDQISWIRSVDQESKLMNPPYPPIQEKPIELEEEIVELYQIVNRNRNIYPSEWKDLKTIVSQYGIDSTKVILNRAQNRRRGGIPWQIFPEYIMSSLRRQAEQKCLTQHALPRHKPISDPDLYAALEGIHVRDQIIRDGWVDINIVTTWRKRMQLMQALGYTIRNPNAWLAHHLLTHIPPPSEEEVRGLYEKPQPVDLWDHPSEAVDQFAQVFRPEERGFDDVLQDHHDQDSTIASWNESSERPTTAEDATETLQARLRKRGGVLMKHDN